MKKIFKVTKIILIVGLLVVLFYPIKIECDGDNINCGSVSVGGEMLKGYEIEPFVVKMLEDSFGKDIPVYYVKSYTTRTVEE